MKTITVLFVTGLVLLVIFHIPVSSRQQFAGRLRKLFVRERV